jgi:hypothetical protein
MTVAAAAAATRQGGGLVGSYETSFPVLLCFQLTNPIAISGLLTGRPLSIHDYLLLFAVGERKEVQYLSPVISHLASPFQKHAIRNDVVIAAAEANCVKSTAAAATVVAAEVGDSTSTLLL